jgi:hypothetical protein
MADESGMQNSHVEKIDDPDVVSTKSVLVKCAEVVISVFAIGLIVDPFNDFFRTFVNQRRLRLDDIAIIYISVGSFVIINTVIILGHLMGDRMPKRTSLLFSITGVILHLVSGAVLVHIWTRTTGTGNAFNNNIYASKQYNDMIISGAVFFFANVIVFAADVFLTIKNF